MSLEYDPKYNAWWKKGDVPDREFLEAILVESNWQRIELQKINERLGELIDILRRWP